MIRPAAPDLSERNATMTRNENEHMVADLLAPEISEMLTRRRMHEVRQSLMELMDPEIADVLMELSPAERAVAFRLLPHDRAVDVFTFLDHDDQQQLIDTLTSEQVAAILNDMDPDDRVNFLEDAPEELTASLMALMRPEERQETQRLLDYPDESVGRLLTTDFLTIQSDWSVEQAWDHIRERGADAETLHTLYLVDRENRLVDHVRLRDLVLARPNVRVDLLRRGQTISLRTDDDREEAVRVMNRYDIPVVPVVDEGNHLVGIVTFDDVADVAAEEVTEDIHKLGGMEALETPYLSARLPALIRKRVVWLMVLFFGGLLTVTAMGFFRSELEKLAVLALFVPLIIASGGNSGSQAATLIIRAMAVGEVSLGDWARVMVREITSGLVMGGILGVIALLLVFFGKSILIGPAEMPVSTWLIAATIAMSVVGVVTTGTIVGSMLPFLLQRLGVDPATGSTPFVATIVDVAGLVIYFTCAAFILNL
jgi:magnesium transporter